jgi:hypothetical protein
MLFDFSTLTIINNQRFSMAMYALMKGTLLILQLNFCAHPKISMAVSQWYSLDPTGSKLMLYINFSGFSVIGSGYFFVG